MTWWEFFGWLAVIAALVGCGIFAYYRLTREVPGGSWKDDNGE